MIPAAHATNECGNTHPDWLEKDELCVSVGQVQGHALQSAWQLALHHPVGSHHYIVDLS